MAGRAGAHAPGCDHLSLARSRGVDMSAVSGRSPRVLAIDAGGTMTDTFIVDETGQFVVGKAQTTPEDESLGFMRSAEDALSYWGLDPAAAFPQIASGIYSGTAMLNRLLERKG